MKLLPIILLICYSYINAQVPILYGCLKGKTVREVHGYPGGAMGSEKFPNWKRPDPKIIPRQKIYFLSVKNDRTFCLFSTYSNFSGEYKINLPIGNYLIKPKRMTGFERIIEKIESQPLIDTTYLIKTIFWDIFKNNKMSNYNLDHPDMIIQKDTCIYKDITTSILFVD